MTREAGVRDGSRPARRARSAVRRVAAGAAIAIAVAALLWPKAVRAQDDDDFELERHVGKVRIEGNQAFDDGDLKGLLRTRGKSFLKFWQKHPLREDFVRADRVTLEAFYRRKGYLYARVDSSTVRQADKKGQSWDVGFFVTEGPRSFITSIQIGDTGPIPEPEIRKRLRFQEGSPLDFGVLEASRDSVIQSYADRGFVLARVADSLRVDSTRVSLQYRITPGPRVNLGEISVSGTRRTRPGYVTREMLLETGDVMRRSKLILSQQRIYDSGLYSDVQMETGNVDSVSHRSDLLVTVREHRMGWIDAGIGYGTVDQLRLTGQWGQRNIFRSSIRFVLSGRLGIRLEDEEDHFQLGFGDRRLDATLTHPWPLGVRILTTLGAYTEEQPILQETDQYLYRAHGGSLVLASSFLRDTRNTGSYEIRYVDQDYPPAAPTDTLPAPPDTAYTTHRLGFSTEHDTRLNIFDPKRGEDVIARVEFVRIAGTRRAGFTNLGLQGSKYFPLPSRAILAARLRVGYIEPWGSQPPDDPLADIPPELDAVPPDDRFRAGGASSVRGYFENELGTREVEGEPVVRGGQVILLSSAEVRFPVLWIVWGVLFFDGGNVWERPQDIKTSKILSFADGAGYNDMRYSVGAGLRISTPVGPFRFEYGWKIRDARADQPDLSSPRGEFHFSLGQPF